MQKTLLLLALYSDTLVMLQSLIDATLDQSRRTGAEIVLVISNRPKVLGLTRAQKANIPTKVNVIQNWSQLQ